MASQEVDGNHSFFLAVAAPPLGAPGVSGGALSAARTSHLTQGSLSTFNQHRGRGSETRDCLCRLARSGPLGRLSGHCLVLLWCPGPVRGAGCRRHRAGGHSEPSAVSPAGGWGWPRQEPKGKGPAFCLKAGGHLPVASWFTRRSERELHHWGGCAEGGPVLRPDTEPPGPEGGLWLWPPSCCRCLVFGPGGAGSRLLVLGRWAREGQPVFSGECLGTGRGMGGSGGQIQPLTGNGQTGLASPPGQVTYTGWACEACVAAPARQREPPSSPLASGLCRG